MKAVLISVNPKWCKLIASGKKTVEVRRTRPKCDTPFKCYIYCTKGKPTFTQSAFCDDISNGKVIGEFVCDRIIDIPQKDLTENFRRLTHDIITPSCLKVQELKDYLGYKDGYGWHITDLVVYEKPRELSEFKKPCNHKNDCCTCDRYDYIGHRCYNEITRPPQSWCYVERSENA